MSVSVDKEAYVTKEKVSVHLRVTDAQGRPVEAHLGMSVFDELYYNPKDTETITGYYQLSTQLRGSIYDPGYYFDANNTDRWQALDLLLLTQGWRAYEWNEQHITKYTHLANYFITDTLFGQLYAKKEKSKVKAGEQFLTIFTGDHAEHQSLQQVDSIGRFVIYPENLFFPKRTFLYAKLLYGKNDLGIRMEKDAETKLRELNTEKYLNYPLPGPISKVPIPDDRLYVVERGVNLLSGVVVGVKKKNPYRDKYLGVLDSLLRQDFVCTYGNLNCPTPGHRVHSTVPVVGQTYTHMTVHQEVVNGEVTNAYIKTNIIYNPSKLTEEEILERYHMVMIAGYYPGKKFYSPAYEGGTWDNVQDYRNTLFWKPDIITDKNGEADVTFYTSDISGKYLINIEGVSGNGLLGSCSSRFLVVRNIN